ncbi:protein of unknown function DUF1980 [Syntrophobotulus glycolicus DSM 8271]|uniref:TIGR03943 family protein n=1 Tax=Syntrophobotulus glycolicus (strain DSM 8271 / FlGlyR) TaxID=645991 RepID=F0SVP9_SYNGF|nr:TIGR03943 family protein [Syntrophobotulus glycolicus]ADY54525.1 protein of unknown function DUF1980 [Syntrophobotulus glycolicus DSM 8271]
MRARAFNPQIFLEFLCYSVFGGLLLYLVSSGKYLSYVTPRMAPYLYFAAVVMGIWALTGLGRLFRPQYRVRAGHCFVLVIPILLLLLPHSPLSIADLSGNYIRGNSFSGGSGLISSYSVPQEQEPVSDSGFNSDIPNAENSTDLPGLDTADRKITVSNDDFSLWLSEIYDNMEKYEGYTIVMTGFVFKNPEAFKRDEFLPARLMMSCCAADLMPTGLICQYDKAAELQAESWVTVEGTLFIGQYEYDGRKSDEPQISATKITPAKKVEGYVYPY